MFVRVFSEGLEIRTCQVSVEDGLLNIEYHKALKRFFDTDDDDHLEPFIGKQVNGHILETDPDVIRAWYHRHEWQYDE